MVRSRLIWKAWTYTERNKGEQDFGGVDICERISGELATLLFGQVMCVTLVTVVTLGNDKRHTKKVA
jgi:hypothetical protein